MRVDVARKLLKNLAPLLRHLGALVVEDAQDAFGNETFDGKRWPARYPSQRPPKVNVAGLLADLTEGRKPKQRRFQDRPVLKDTGALLASTVAGTPSGNRIEVGSQLPYASVQQTGGVTRQAVGKQAKEGLARYLKGQANFEDKSDKRVKKGLAAKGRILSAKVAKIKEDLAGGRITSEAAKAGRAEVKEGRGRVKEQRDRVRKKAAKRRNLLRERVGFLFSFEVLQTKVIGRPFLAVSETLEERLARATENFFAEMGVV